MYMVPLTIFIDTYGLCVRHENLSLIGQIDSEIQSQVSDRAWPRNSMATHPQLYWRLNSAYTNLASPCATNCRMRHKARSPGRKSALTIYKSASLCNVPAILLITHQPPLIETTVKRNSRHMKASNTNQAYEPKLLKLPIVNKPLIESLQSPSAGTKMRATFC